jgi:lipid II:glycine glycyltransferase (peptidoglycan interpeptide bridge formation enzyme)
VKTPLFPPEFFIEANNHGVGKFLIVKHEGKVIGGSMIVTHERVSELGSERVSELGSERGHGGTVYEWFECGLNAEYKELYPSVMATYAGIEYAAEHGYARYDMMGAGEPGVPYGVRDFKAEFGGEMVEQGRFLCICHPILYKLGVLGVKILRKS